MEETIAQAAPNNGASSAEDFQPTTQNPQGNTSNVQQQRGLENITNPQEFLDQNRTTELSVVAQPAPVQPQSDSNNVTTLVLIASVAIVLAILLFKIADKLPAKKSASPSRGAGVNTGNEITQEVTPTKQPLKQKPKKTKRRNR